MTDPTNFSWIIKMIIDAPTVYHVIMTIDGLLSTTFVEEIVEQTDVQFQ